MVVGSCRWWLSGVPSDVGCHWSLLVTVVSGSRCWRLSVVASGTRVRQWCCLYCLSVVVVVRGVCLYTFCLSVVGRWLGSSLVVVVISFDWFSRLMLVVDGGCQWWSLLLVVVICSGW